MRAELAKLTVVFVVASLLALHSLALTEHNLHLDYQSALKIELIEVQQANSQVDINAYPNTDNSAVHSDKRLLSAPIAFIDDTILHTLVSACHSVTLEWEVQKKRELCFSVFYLWSFMYSFILKEDLPHVTLFK